MLAKTVFIVGAGASYEAGLPVGSGLLDNICNALSFRFSEDKKHITNGDKYIYDTLCKINGGSDLNAYLDAARKVETGASLSSSIDNFIDVHQDNEKIQRVGKIAIAKSILDAERESALFWDQALDRFVNRETLSNSWYTKFFKKVNEGVRKSELGRIFEKISFVVFNYDRCLEHFLFYALQDHFGITQSEAAELVINCSIFHPYGVISDLEWQNSAKGVRFGETPNSVDLLEMASGIRTFTEQVAESDALEKIRNAVSGATSLVFLGFSYGQQNLRLLKPKSKCKTERIFGTTKGLFSPDVYVIAPDLRRLVEVSLEASTLPSGNHLAMGDAVYLANITCADLMDQYSRNLFV